MMRRSVAACLILWLVCLSNILPSRCSQEARSGEDGVSSVLNRTTFVIKSSGRILLVKRLLRSIAVYHPKAKIIVADDGAVPLKNLLGPNPFSRFGVKLDLTIIQLHVDAGLAYGRNALVRAVSTEFLAYFDDDFVVTPLTNIHRLLMVLDESDTDLVGGMVSDRPSYIGFGLDISTGVDGERVLRQRDVVRTGKRRKPCVQVDLVPNFFVAKAESLRLVWWDHHFKLGEHEDFFLRAKGVLKVQSCDFSVISHAPSLEWYNDINDVASPYALRRRRAFHFQQLFLQKHNIVRYETSSGSLLAGNALVLTEQANQHARQAREAYVEVARLHGEVTAVLISYKRPENIFNLVGQLARKEGVRQIVVWNNNPAQPFNEEDLKDATAGADVLITLFNSPENLNTEGRYKACASLAMHDACFFIDDDFNPRCYDELRLMYMQDPTLVHASTTPVVWANNIRWALRDADLNLHAGFSWVGSGAMVSRERVKHFVEHQLPLLPARWKPICDNVFTLWTNTFPSMSVSPLNVEGLSQDFAYSNSNEVVSRLDQLRRFGGEVLCAVTRCRLHGHLTADVPLTTLGLEGHLLNINCKAFFHPPVRFAYNEQEGMPIIAANRGMLFKSNLWPAFVRASPARMVKNPDTWAFHNNAVQLNWYIWHDAHPIALTLSDPRHQATPEHRILTEGESHLMAIDGDSHTRWVSVVDARAQAWFEVDLGGIVSLGTLHVEAHPMQKELIVNISSDGTSWTSFTFMHRSYLSKCTNGLLTAECVRVSYDFRGIDGRMVRFVSHWHQNHPFVVWEITHEEHRPLSLIRSFTTSIPEEDQFSGQSAGSMAAMGITCVLCCLCCYYWIRRNLSFSKKEQ